MPSGLYQPQEKCGSDYRVARRGGPHRGSVPCAGDGLVFRCRVDRAIAEWRVEQGDLWDLREGVGKGTHHELSTDFFKVPLACGVEGSGSSCGDRRR